MSKKPCSNAQLQSITFAFETAGNKTWRNNLKKKIEKWHGSAENNAKKMCDLEEDSTNKTNYFLDVLDGLEDAMKENEMNEADLQETNKHLFECVKRYNGSRSRRDIEEICYELSAVEFFLMERQLYYCDEYIEKVKSQCKKKKTKNDDAISQLILRSENSFEACKRKYLTLFMFMSHCFEKDSNRQPMQFSQLVRDVKDSNYKNIRTDGFEISLNIIPFEPDEHILWDGVLSYLSFTLHELLKTVGISERDFQNQTKPSVMKHATTFDTGDVSLQKTNKKKGVESAKKEIITLMDKWTQIQQSLKGCKMLETMFVIHKDVDIMSNLVKECKTICETLDNTELNSLKIRFIQALCYELIFHLKCAEKVANQVIQRHRNFPSRFEQKMYLGKSNFVFDQMFLLSPFLKLEINLKIVQSSNYSRINVEKRNPFFVIIFIDFV
ncbi:hypothetical protein RFI_22087 [Reticulomyxa filosa]|uniref:Uncharacterized protein n=1 Tax=Reticulomyxa filosa TaxID=46433 RepID=X6MPA3_RETFI|nr:hypothetical protein RFI_22087 [Reticulomyxa filosa]|eukprot:ETO15277.1 hypothetical protein RFI_22087 [Reticulomyxa filosa]